jgi:uncharacterized repeat protein (TIGR03803 family)
MPWTSVHSRHPALATVLALAAFLPLASARAATLDTLYSFAGGNDGDEPQAPLIADDKGNLYGTTSGGGAVCGGDYCGTVFELMPGGQEIQLYVFKGGTDGITPTAGLLRDDAGNFYGTTSLGGGSGGCSDGQTRGCGTVFTLAPDGTESVLYRFTGGVDGSGPAGTLVRDRHGNLFGTTMGGGAEGDGAVFKLAPDGTETVLHSFSNGGDGGVPVGGLIADAKGRLYGTALNGGANGQGVIFEIAPDGNETVLYNFCGKADCADGAAPSGGLLLDKAGNLYGTAGAGGAKGWGVVFKLAPRGAESVVYSFKGGSDGIEPAGGVIADAKGNLYGATYLGGAVDDGTLYAISPGGRERVLYTFDGGTDGTNPTAALLLVKNTLYGTTTLGGAHDLGNVFKIRK